MLTRLGPLLAGFLLEAPEAKHSAWSVSKQVTENIGRFPFMSLSSTFQKRDPEPSRKTRKRIWLFATKRLPLVLELVIGTHAPALKVYPWFNASKQVLEGAC